MSVYAHVVSAATTAVDTIIALAFVADQRSRYPTMAAAAGPAKGKRTQSAPSRVPAKISGSPL
jgi:hypothetical protein